MPKTTMKTSAIYSAARDIVAASDHPDREEIVEYLGDEAANALAEESLPARKPNQL